MASREEIIAELKRRGVDVEGVATQNRAQPQGASAQQGPDLAGLASALQGESAAEDNRMFYEPANNEEALEAVGDAAMVAGLALPAARVGGLAARAGFKALPGAAQAALKRGAGRVLGGGATRSSAARGASRAYPAGPYSIGARGAAVEGAGAGAKASARSLAAETVGPSGVAGQTAAAIGGASAEAVDGDVAPGQLLRGAAMGMLTNSPVGRMALTKTLSRLVGQKYQPWLWQTLHPVTRRKAGVLGRSLRGYVQGGLGSEALDAVD